MEYLSLIFHIPFHFKSLYSIFHLPTIFRIPYSILEGANWKLNSIDYDIPQSNPTSMECATWNITKLEVVEIIWVIAHGSCDVIACGIT
jgi:hypothetical protein